MLTNEQRSLVTENIELAYFVLDRSGFGGKDEYESAALYGLCKAAKKYDPSKGTAFSTFAYWVIKNEINEEGRRNLTRKKYEVLMPYGQVSVVDELRVFSWEPEEADTLYQREVLEEIQKYIEGASKKRKRVLEVYIALALSSGQPPKIKEVSKKAGAGIAYTYRVVKQLRDKVSGV